MLKNYCYLNNVNDIVQRREFFSENGLKDLLEETISAEDLEYPYPLKGGYQIALTHSKYSEEYHSFVNGQNTTGRNTLAAYREAV
jgi:topoisomerase-4 subunit B